jgi:hypothetical protein
MDDREETMDVPGMQQWNEGPRLKEAAMSEEGDDIQQDLQEDSRAKIEKPIVRSLTGLREVSD